MSMAEKKEEKKKPKNLDDFLDQLAQEHSKSLDESFKAYDEFHKDENQLHMYNRILTPAQDSLYTALVSNLDNKPKYLTIIFMKLRTVYNFFF